MRKITASIASILLKTYMRLYKSDFRLVQMRSYHLKEAAQLLARQFCADEPLCQALGITEEEIKDFFFEQVKFSSAKGLGVVVEHNSGRVVGVMTIEDHKDQMPVDATKLSPKVAPIGQILDRVKLPTALEPETCGEVYYVGIGAVDSAYRSQNILRTMIIGSYTQMVSKGYKMGYAKISSPAVLRSIQRIEKMLPFPFFKQGELKQADEIPELVSSTPGQLKNFKLALIHWGYGAYQGQPLEVIA